MKLSKLLNIIVNTLTGPKKPKFNNYQKAIYPLLNVGKNARGNYKPETMYAYAQDNEHKSHIELAISTAAAMKNLQSGYYIRPLINGDFIASRKGANAYVKVLAEESNVINKEQSNITRDDIDALVEQKQMYNCDAIILVSLALLPFELKFYAKANDVFVLTGYDFIELLEPSNQRAVTQYQLQVA